MDMLFILVAIVGFYLLVMAIGWILAKLIFPARKLSEDLEEKLQRLDRLNKGHTNKVQFQHRKRKLVNA